MQAKLTECQQGRRHKNFQGGQQKNTEK